MNDRQQASSQPAAQTQTSQRGETEFQKLLNQPHRGTCEYVPYGAQDKIKLTVPIIQNLIAVPTKLGKTCSERDAIKFLAMCQAKRMNPFEGDCYLIGYDSRDGATATFSFITAHQTYLKRAELHPEFDGMKSGVIVLEDGVLKDLEGDFYQEGQRVVGGWSTIYFKNRKHEMHKRLRLERFQKSFGVWQDDAAGMICKCAEADGLRSAFPTMLGGLYLREEMAGPDPELSKPVFATPAKPFFSEKAKTSNDLPAPAPEPEPSNDYVAEPTIHEPAALSNPAPAPEGETGANPLKSLRGLCRLGKVKEGELLDFLAQSGSTDGSCASLEDVQLQYPEVIKLAYDRWSNIVEKIKAVKGEPK